MSATLPDRDLDPERDPDLMSAPGARLAALRGALDRIDEALHDTLMARATLVEQVATLKGAVAWRPGREAAIIRRLLARHQGALPRQALVRIWRELLSGTVAIQGSVLITVCDIDETSAYTQLAREHFGALTPLRAHRSPVQAIAEVSAGIATAAVLPLPVEDEPRASAWWLALLHRDAPRIHVVARLPFWAPRPEGVPQRGAMVVAAVPPDASGDDRSLLGLEVSPDLSRARLAAAIEAAGFAPGTTILRRDPGEPALAFVEVPGLIADDDQRLTAIEGILRPPVVLGACAAPIEGSAG